MITVKEVDKTYFDLYDQVSMNVEVHSIYKLKRLDSGLGGFHFEEVPVDAATVAGPTENLYMLSGRKDACVLWDIRVEDKRKILL